MTKQVIKSIVFGALLGAAVFFMPFFLLRVVAFFLALGLLFKIFSNRRFGKGFGPGMHPKFMNKIRNMSEEEYTKFKQKFEGQCGKGTAFAE